MLTEIAVRRTAVEPDKSRKLFDGGGLYLLVAPTGSKYWRLKYYFEGKERLLALGVYPRVTLKEAREFRDAARKLVSAGINPGKVKRDGKAKASATESDSFEAVAREWYGRREAVWVPAHAKTVIQRLEVDVFPWIGERPIAEITAPELLTVLRRIEERGAVEVAHRVCQIAGQIFRYAIATSRATRDPSPDLRGALAPARGRHHAALTQPNDVANLMRAIAGYEGSFVVRCALRMSAYTFPRPGELRKAEWSEFDLDRAEWRIPAQKMKMRQEHIVPLARQTVEILTDLHPLTSRSGKWVFPGGRQRSRPMSENAISAALRAMGYERDDMTAHGFRTTASTLLNEAGWAPDVIERQLAHSPRDKVRAAYNRASYMDERRRMMQEWADKLDRLATSRSTRSAPKDPTL